MPKKSFDAIRVSSDLRFSRVYGDCSKSPTAPSDHTRHGENSVKFPGVVGYTGRRVRPVMPVRLDWVDPRADIGKSLPGYTGYIPGRNPESVFGKSYGVVASACSDHVHRYFGYIVVVHCNPALESIETTN